MAAQTCTWLHLSDLHFRESTSWDADIVLRELLKDIKARVTVDDLRPNLIFVTGDIAYSGKKSEYRLAATFFDQLLGVTGLDKKHLFVVPGNHDVDREAITPGTQSITRGLDSRDKLNQHFQTPSDRQAVFQKFRQFAGFVNKYFEDHVPFDDEHYYYVRLLTIAKRRVAILGLNSAWLSLSDEDRNHLALGERQVRNALDRASGADLKIALLHHPFDWLYDFDREDIETLLQSECDFILRGHLHRTGAQYLTTPDSAAMILTGGACYKTRAYPNTYHFVRLDFSAGRGTVVLRRYSPSNFWAKDTLTYKNASNGEYLFLDSKLYSTVEPVLLKKDVEKTHPRRIDAMLPKSGRLGRPINLIVAAKMPDSPHLSTKEIAEKKVAHRFPKEEGEVSRGARSLSVSFLEESDGVALQPAILDFRIDAPAFIMDKSRVSLTIEPDRDSEECVFTLTPQQVGIQEVRVEVFRHRADILLGSLPLEIEITRNNGGVSSATSIIFIFLSLPFAVVSTPIGVHPPSAPTPTQLDLKIYLYESDYVLEFEPRDLVRPLGPIPTADLPRNLPISEVADIIVRRALQQHGFDQWQRMGAQGNRLRLSIRDQVWFKSKEAELCAALESRLFQGTSATHETRSQPREEKEMETVDSLASPDVEQGNRYEIAAIRQLLEAAFTPQDLRRFCQDRPVLSSIVPHFSVPLNLKDMVDTVIEFGQKWALFDELLAEIERYNSRQYRNYRDRIYRGAAPTEGVSEPGQSPTTPSVTEPQGCPTDGYLSTQEHIQLLFEQGDQFLKKKDWEGAIEKLQEVLLFDTGHHEAKDLLRIAQQELEREREDKMKGETLKALYAQAKHYIDIQRWKEAILLLEQIKASNPNFENVQELWKDVQEEIERERESRRKEQELGFLYERACEHSIAREWNEAIRFFEQVTKLDQNYGDAQDRLKEARKERDLEMAYKTANKAYKAGRWTEAIRELEKIDAEEPDYLDAKQLLERARTQEKLANLYSAAQADLDAERWEPAYRRFKQILQIEPTYRETSLASHYACAQIQIEKEQWDEALKELSEVVQIDPSYREAAASFQEVQKQVQLKELYLRGESYLSSNDWGNAQSVFEQINNMDSHYRQTLDLLAKAKEEGELADTYSQAMRYLELERWGASISLLRDIIERRRLYKSAADKLILAEREKRREDLYKEGLSQAAEGHWRNAIVSFEQIMSESPDYRDTASQLEKARRQQMLAEQYDRGLRASRQQQWTDAIDAFEQVVKLDNKYLDAPECLEQARRQRYLSNFYQEGLEHFEGKRWEQAVYCFAKVTDQEQRYMDAAARLEESQRQAEQARIFENAKEAFGHKQWTQALHLLCTLPRSYENGLVAEMVTEAQRQQDLEQLYDQARLSFNSEQWSEALPFLNQILVQQSDYHDVVRMREEAQRQIQLNKHYQAGIAALKSQHWDMAIKHLDQVVQIDSRYLDALQKLTEARRHKRLADLYRSGLASATKQEWPEAISEFEKIRRLDPNYKDTKEQIELFKVQEQLQHLYDEGLTLAKGQQWKKASEIFGRIVSREKDYRDAAAQLTLAETELRLAEAYSSGCRYLELKQWSEAIEQFVKVVEENSEYKDAVTKLEEAQREKHLADQWTEAHDLLNPEQEREITPTALERAIDRLTEIVSWNEAYRDGEAQALLEQTQNQLAALRERIEQERAEEERRRQEKLTSVYAQASELLDEKQHRQAIPLLEEILRIQPGYRDAEEKLKQAKRLKPFQPVAQFVERIKRSNWARSLESRSGNRRVPVLIGVSILLVIVLCAGTVIILLGGNGTPTPTSIAVVTTPAPTTPTSIAVVTTPAPTTPMPTATSLSPTSQATITATAIEPTTPGTPTEMPVIAPTSTSTPSPTPTATATAVPSPTPVLPTKTLTPALPPPLSPAPTSRLSGKIAFPLYDPERRTYDVYVCNADGSNRRRIATEASQPEMPPSGNMIAFRSWNDSSRGITVMDLDGSNRFNATNSLEDARPSWATNKSLLLFSRKEADRNGRLYVDGAWQGEETQLIQHGTSPAYGETPSWLNMDRQTVVYSLCNPGCGIFVCNRNGQGPTRLLDDPGKTTPEGSPDGTHIAFMSNRDGNWEIYVMNADASKLKRLTNDSAIDGLPTWSPDGSYIAFVSNRTGNQNWSIWAIRPDGTGLQKLFDLDGTMDGVVDEEPTYSSAGWKEEQISWTR